MARKRSRYDRAVSHLTRRRALASGAALLTAGGTLVWVGQPSQAAVSVESFSAQSATFDAEQVAPVVDATIAWDYDVGTEVVSAIRLSLAVDGTQVATEDLRTDRTTLNGETTLSAPVTDSDAWAASDFDPDVADSVTREVTVTVTLAVLDDGDNAIVSDEASDTATITVAHPQESKYVASVGGSATFSTPSG